MQLLSSDAQHWKLNLPICDIACDSFNALLEYVCDLSLQQTIINQIAVSYFF